MKFRRMFTSLSLVLSLTVAYNVAANAATVRIQGWTLVDSGKHLDWGGSTKYQSLFNNSVTTWNNYKAGVIRQDTSLTIQDVTICDFTEASTTAGVTYSDGNMKFNTYILDKVSVFNQQNCTLHELGHALGLAHNTSTDVMYEDNTTKTTLSDNDKASYDSAYNYY